EQGPVTGEAPLTPIQFWLFETMPRTPERFSQSVTVELVEDVDELALRAALAAVVAHHDAVRMRYERVDRVWRQTNGPIEAPGLSTVDGGGFDLANGPLVRAVLRGR